jgi:hypothetical protein
MRRRLKHNPAAAPARAAADAAGSAFKLNKLYEYAAHGTAMRPTISLF